MESIKIIPEVGRMYTNRNGSQYLCQDYVNGSAYMVRVKDGWELIAHGICQYLDSTIEWDYSTGGHWNQDYTNDVLYYEEIIQGDRKPRDAAEMVIAGTLKNASMALAYIGKNHPAFEPVFKYFVAQNYPDLEQRLLLPLKHLSADSHSKNPDRMLPDKHKS